MKKILVLFASSFLIVVGCNKSASDENFADDEQEPAATQRKCSSYEVLEEQIKADPSLRDRMDEIEKFTRQFKDNPNMGRLVANGIIEIPVVFNVLYKTTGQNVSDAQLQSQIDV